LILVSIDDSHMHSLHKLVTNLIYYAKGSIVSNGMEWLMCSGRLLTIDEYRLAAQPKLGLNKQGSIL
jgi:hypothetical protein